MAFRRPCRGLSHFASGTGGLYQAEVIGSAVAAPLGRGVAQGRRRLRTPKAFASGGIRVFASRRSAETTAKTAFMKRFLACEISRGRESVGPGISSGSRGGHGPSTEDYGIRGPKFSRICDFSHFFRKEGGSKGRSRLGACHAEAFSVGGLDVSSGRRPINRLRSRA